MNEVKHRESTFGGNEFHAVTTRSARSRATAQKKNKKSLNEKI